MSGVVVIRYLLAQNGAVTAVVPATRIQAGALPEGIALPAISVTEVSSVDRNILNPLEKVRVTERTRVTVMAANYPQQKSLIDLVRGACRDKIGDFNGVTTVVVLTDIKGPDFSDDTAQIFMQSQDFKVSFNQIR